MNNLDFTCPRLMDRYSVFITRNFFNRMVKRGQKSKYPPETEE